ncbi:MAG: nucleoside deaminase [Anaerolineales bacterium]|nr:nucleoside deaminase [Anaerolineales bacterium]
MWENLSLQWQAALEMAWEAYCAGTIPIGAVVADANGNIVSRGRNRIMDISAPDGQVYNDMLAHAEINALLALNLDQENRHDSALYTTMEPCPLCMGAFYMSSVRTLHFAARDPWAGSTNLLGTTPYLSRKSIKVFEPFDAVLEDILVALFTEYELHNRGEEFLSHRFFDITRAVLPNAVEKGIVLHRSGGLRKKQKAGLPANQVFDWLAHQVQ